MKLEPSRINAEEAREIRKDIVSPLDTLLAAKIIAESELMDLSQPPNTRYDWIRLLEAADTLLDLRPTTFRGDLPESVFDLEIVPLPEDYMRMRETPRCHFAEQPAQTPM